MTKPLVGRHPHRFALLFSAVFAVALSGCVSLDRGTQGTSATTTAALNAAPARSAQARGPQPAPSVSWTDGERDPERLLRMDRADLASTLGEPRMVRRDLTAEVWQYSLDGCILDVFLYPEATEARVAYFEFRSRQLELAASDLCFETMLLRRKRSIEDS